MEEEYKLCYVEGQKAYFTSNFEKQWGDDWNDRPYECNAGEPYDDWSELIEDNEVTDEQLMAVFNYSQKGVKGLESFRTE